MTEREEPTGPVGWVDLIDPLLDFVERAEGHELSAFRQAMHNVREEIFYALLQLVIETRTPLPADLYRALMNDRSALLNEIEDDSWREESARWFDVLEAQQETLVRASHPSEEDMPFTLDGRVVADVSYDFPRVLLATTDRWQLTVEGDFTFTHQGTVYSSLADQDEEIVALLREGIGAPIRRFSIHVDGSLSFDLAGGSFRVEHDPELEAWSFIGPGQRVAMARTGQISPRRSAPAQPRDHTSDTREETCLSSNPR